MLDTPELLEQTLASIDNVRSLLLAQRVSRSWQAALEKSLALQQALYLLPERADDCKQVTNSIVRRHNPLRAEVFAPWFRDLGLELRESDVFSDPGHDPFRETFGPDDDQRAAPKTKGEKKRPPEGKRQ